MKYKSTVKSGKERAEQFEAWLAGQDDDVKAVVEYHLAKLTPLLGAMGRKELLALLYDYVGRML